MMQVDLRLPVITGKTDREKLEQLQSYLHQTVEQLQWAFNHIDSGSGDGYVVVNGRALDTGSGTASGKTPKQTFNEIKSLIIKSADIIEAYSEEIQAELEGKYVAASDFGVYQEETNQKIEANSTGLDQLFTNVQTISGTVDGLYDASIETNAYIRHGLLEYGEDGAPVYGIEVGQTNEIDGVETFSKFARFTSGKLSFYDNNETEVAYISDYKLHITNAEVTGNLTVGRYMMDTADGIAFLWVGGDG